MPYRFATERPDYADLASGRVLLGLPGHPAFPVRLASEIFQRCLARREAGAGMPGLYDPCCGAAYHLTTLAYLHGPSIREIAGSDVDADAVRFARRNLDLLSAEGLARRMDELAEAHRRFGKDSHQAALGSARALRAKLGAQPIPARVFQADALDGEAMALGLAGMTPDIVLTDVPYGQHSQWRGQAAARPDPIAAMLQALLRVVHAASVVALVCDRRQKVGHERYQRVERFQIGKRQVVLLKPAS